MVNWRTSRLILLVVSLLAAVLIIVAWPRIPTARLVALLPSLSSLFENEPTPGPVISPRVDGTQTDHITPPPAYPVVTVMRVSSPFAPRSTN